MEELGTEAREKLNRGISHGLKTVDHPSPAIQAFLEDIERYPNWVEMERLQRGSEAFLSIGSTWLTLSLGPGSLTHTYSSPSIASVLVKTGNLTKMAQRRLLETGTWNIASILPGGLLRGADGYIHNVQVRLLHARVRKTLLQRHWDQNAMGTPINQVEMTRTWLDFTYVPFSALHKFGLHSPIMSSQISITSGNISPTCSVLMSVSIAK
ncbi:oxygenase MpaB family protein [Dictyobacter kobayashii]|nr:oxygenase MpaB family protein [Dictyobacter kobayashii]